jgi:hypothetical protein
MQVRVVVAVLVVISCLIGCEAGPPPVSTAGNWCRETCAPALVAELNGNRCACAPVDGACSVDRLIVTPLPPRRKPPAERAGTAAP